MDADGEISGGVILYQNKEVLMKTIKRILAVLLLIVTVLVVSYFIYTAKQIPKTEALYEITKNI